MGRNNIDINADTNPFVEASQNYMAGKQQNQQPAKVLEQLEKQLRKEETNK